MSDPIYKKIEVVGSSTTSSDEAIRNAIERTSQTVREMRWFEVVELRGNIEDGRVAHWQATVKIGFRVSEDVGEPNGELLSAAETEMVRS